jgi:hypothetical protein
MTTLGHGIEELIRLGHDIDQLIRLGHSLERATDSAVADRANRNTAPTNTPGIKT